MKVKLSVVGMYFGAEVDVAGDNPSVIDVLQAAKVQTASSASARFDYTVTTSPTGQPDEFFISNITVTHLTQPTSRKKRPEGQPNRYTSGVYSFSDQLSEAEVLEKISRGEPLLVWQYYIFEPPVEGGGDLGDTVGDDGLIIPINKSNSLYTIAEGGTVLLRLIALFGGPTGQSYRESLIPGFATSKQFLQDFASKT